MLLRAQAAARDPSSSIKRWVRKAIGLEKAKVYSQNTPFRDYNRDMTVLQHMTVRDFRKLATGMAGEWIAAQDAATGTYTVRCGDMELCTVNGRKPRTFRSLDVVFRVLEEEIGVTEFRVVVEK